MRARVIIVADDPLSASALRTALRVASNLEVIDGYVADGVMCARTLETYGPDVVVVDQLPSRDKTIACVRAIRAALATVKIIVLSTTMERGWLSAVTVAGADAAIAKTFRLQGVGMLVREVTAGHVFHAFRTGPPSPRSATTAELAKLTDRELEILRLAADGSPNVRIAARLWITEQTVKFHLSNVYRKLGVANRTEASHVAYAHGLLDGAARADIAA
jgi:DNA-binding NarL/FixJ family response regulator